VSDDPIVDVEGNTLIFQLVEVVVRTAFSNRRKGDGRIRQGIGAITTTLVHLKDETSVCAIEPNEGPTVAPTCAHTLFNPKCGRRDLM